MTKNYLSSTEKEAIEEFKTRILQKLGRKKVLAVKIFGSKARGDSKETSDIDVLVLLKTPTFRAKEIIFDIATQILIKYGVDLSVKVFSQREFRKGLNLEIPFYLEVDKESLAL